MIIFVNNKTTKLCQITLRIKRYINKRKVFPFFCIVFMIVYNYDVHLEVSDTCVRSSLLS